MRSTESAFEEKIAAYKSTITRYLESVVNEKPPHSLYGPIRYTLTGGGKKLRPILLMLSVEALGGKPEKAVAAAAAVEILHNFTLVHDDIMDHDETRRGQPTVHHKWDVNVALLAGDGLVALAYQNLLKTPTSYFREIHQVFTNGIIEICEGQALDKEFETRRTVQMQEYLEMVAKKTGSLLRMCAQIGGYLGKGDTRQIEALQIFGESLGIAFQIQDDLLDITGSEIAIGKDFGSDIKRRKKTYLLVHALQHANALQRQQIFGVLQKDEIELPDILIVRQQFEEIGTLRSATDTVAEYIGKAESSLDRLDGTVNGADLREFLKLVLKRKA